MIQKSLMDLTEEVGRHAFEENNNENCLKQLKRNMLIELGLPLKNLAQLKSFDANLKKDDFYKKMVLKFLYHLLCIPVIPQFNTYFF